MQTPSQKTTPGQTLEQLKTELGKLSSYTQEIGKASQAAGAVGEVVGKIQRLADDAVRVMQEAAQSAASDFTKKVKQQSSALEEIVSRQRQLADELATFRSALEQAARFADSLEAVQQRFDQLEATVTAQQKEITQALADQNQSHQASGGKVLEAVGKAHTELRIWQWLTFLTAIGALVASVMHL